MLGLGNSLVISQPPSAADTTSFISTWDTTGSDEKVTLPFVSSGTINFTIDWGDGNSDTVTAWNDNLGGGAIDHTYSSAATYTITMAGTISGFKFANGGDKLKIKTITQWGTLDISTNNAFNGCSNLVVSAKDAPTISSTDLLSTFQSCGDMLTLGTGVSLWNTAAVTNMSSMFNGSGFNGDISDWDTGEVINMYYMFGWNSAFNQDIGSWNVAKVAAMNAMFYRATSFNQDLSDWDTGAVTTMHSMFYTATSYVGTGVDSFDIADVTDMTDMFSGANALTTAIYDALLIAWEGQTEQADVAFHAGDATYTGGGTAATARAALVTNGWTITDGGIA